MTISTESIGVQMPRSARLVVTLPLSVVIATLGTKMLEQTIQCLNGGTCIPDEILVCIPEGVACEAQLDSHDNLRVVRTPCRGQVGQRAFGLSMARSPFVMQMDDDVLLPEDALGRLLAACEACGPGSALAPLLKNCQTGQYLTRYTRDFKGLLQNLVATVICGAPWGAARMGVIAPAGIGYAVDKDCCDGRSLVETEWLPGGCVICRREDLVTDSYFPFPGKAFCEDVMHSVLWRQRGVRLWVAPEIACCTYLAPMPADRAGILADYRARVHVIHLNGGSIARCRFWFAFFIVKQWVAKLLLRPH